MNRFTRTAVVGLVALGLSTGVASAAFAAPDPAPVPAAPGEGPLVPTYNQKVRCTRAVQNRLISMNRWTNAINRRPNLTGDQKTAIVALMTPVANALTTVTLPALEAATDLATIKDLCRSIVRQYRVYKLVHQQVFLTAASNAWLNRLATLQTASAFFEGLGKDVTQLNKRIEAAYALVYPIPAAVAALTPEDYNAAPKATDKQLWRYRRDLEAARRHIKKAERISSRIENSMI